MKDSPLRRAVCIDDSSSVLRDVALCPPGVVPGRNGSFTVNRKSAELIQAEIEAMGVESVIDWEHQTLGGKWTSPDGRAPASGWIQRVAFDERRGIVASVAWTEEAVKAIRRNEYKYLSPVFELEEGIVVGLNSTALTNKPAIPHSEVVVASNRLSDTEKKTMVPVTEPAAPAAPDATQAPDPMLSLGIIAERLGIEVTSQDLAVALAQVADAIPEKKEGDKKKEEEGGDKKPATETVANSVRTALGLKEGAPESEMLVAINSLRGNDKTVGDMRGEIDGLKQSVAHRDADDLMRPYLVANKINPADAADVKVCNDLAMSDPEAFKHHMDRREPYAPPGKTTAPAHTSGGATDRKSQIVNSARFFDDNADAMRSTDKTTFVNGELIGAGHKAMTEEESAGLAG